MNVRLRGIFLGCVLSAMIASLIANAILYRYAIQKTRDLISVTLDPHGSGVYRRANDELAKSTRQKRIVLLGDSRMQQWTNWPHRDGWELINRGIGGQTTTQILGRVVQDATELKPDIVVLQMGINDLKAIGLFPQHAKALTQSCHDNLMRMARHCQASGAQVVLLTIFPSGPVEWARRVIWSPEIDQAVREVNQQLLKIQEPGIHAFDGSEILAPGGNPVSSYYEDTLHLSPKGYAALNASLTTLLDSLTASPEARP